MMYKIYWQGGVTLKELVEKRFSAVPAEHGVYLISETANKPVPNPATKRRDDPGREQAIQISRNIDCILYIGKAASATSNLRTRLGSYYIQDYEAGVAPVPKRNKHKGAAWLHTHQNYPDYSPTLYVWWIVIPNALQAETHLIRHMHPYLNTYKRFDSNGKKLSPKDL